MLRYSTPRVRLLGARVSSAGLIVLAFSRSAGANTDATEVCHGPRIVAADTLSERWRDAVEDVRARLDGMARLDRCAELFLEPSEDNLRVRVALADGRSTIRELASPEALYPTLRALLSLPPDDPQPIVERVSLKRAPPRTVPARSGAEGMTKPHLETGIGGMGRVASAPLYGAVGLAAFAQLNVDRWLLGVSARWDAVDALVSDAPPSGFNMQTLALGIDFGIRSSFRGFTVDALVGPEARIENQEAFGGQTTPDGVGGGTSDVRIDLSLRVANQPGRSVRFFAEGDIDASPARLAKTRQLDPQLPTLPAWSAGLALGVLWSLP